MKRVVLTGMVVFILVVAGLPTVAVVANRNFPGDSTYSTATMPSEDSSAKREQKICREIKDRPQKEVCKKE